MMKKVYEDYKNALNTVDNVVAILKNLNWKSDTLDDALDAVGNLLQLANRQANAGVSEVDWELNAMIDNTADYGSSDKDDYLGNVKKIQKYLENEVKGD